ncbi:MAG: response regulator transcription factor [Clostridia bacterium]|nr:response regulator transcription factor [Clostridia bacterium]
MSVKILVIEDDAFLRDGLCEMLKKEGYNVVTAGTIDDAKECFLKEHFNLVILDVMLPDGNGFDMCAFIRSKNENVPILFLTACDDEVQVVRGLDAGADDYVTKPFKLLELLSRIRALLRRSKASVYNCENISVDINTMTVKRDGENIFVTPTEFQILSALIRNSGVIVTRSVLLENIWDEGGSFIDDNTLSVHISRLREKIGAEHVVTVRGIGYRWEDSQ